MNLMYLLTIFIGRTDVEAEAQIFWPPDAKNWLIGKDPDAGKDWRQEKKGTTEHEMVGWYHQLNGHEFEQALGVGLTLGREAWCASVHGVTRSRTQLSDWTELNNTGSDSKESACNVGDLSSIPGSKDTLEKEKATQSGILAWRIPWSEEPGRLPSIGCKESDMTEWLTHMGDGKGQGSPVTKSWTLLSGWTMRTQYNYFPSVQYRIVNCRFYAIQQISRTYSFYITETKPTGQQLLIFPPFNLWQAPFYWCFIWLFRYFI